MSTENLTREECAVRASTVKVSNYEIHLNLTDVANSANFGSVTRVSFSAKPGASTWIDLIAPSINKATLNGEVLDSAAFDGNRLQLTGLKEENVLVVDAVCAYSNTGEGLHKFTDPADNEIYLYSQFEIADARRVFACFDQPNLKATYEFTIDAPAHWKVFSNTFAEVTELDNGARHKFAETKVMSTYITAIVAGDYFGVTDWYAGQYGTYPLGWYCRKSLAEFLDHEEMFETTKQGFEQFEKDFGVGYPFEKYDQIIVPEFNAGAMENAGCVTYYEGVIYRSRATDHEREFRSNVILHEMAHMWFGNLVTMNWWDDLWLNESFAEWASYYANNKATRFTQAWTSFLVDRKFAAYREDQLSSTHPVSTDMVDLDAVETNFDMISYAKGASALRQLVSFVGEKEFLAGVSAYLKKYAWGNTELKDLLDELAKASGRDLSQFTDTWLLTSGVNMFKPEIELNADGTYKSIAVLQLPPAEPVGLPAVLRKHRFAVSLFNKVAGGLEQVKTIEIDIEGARTEIKELAGVKQPDLLVLNADDATYAKIRLDERSLKTAVESLGEIPDSLPRALLMAAAWDMTRDAEMSTSDFLDLIIRALPNETFIPIIQRVLMQLRTAGQLYSHPDNREKNMLKLSDAFQNWAKTFPVGSDAQFAAAKNFVGTARTEVQLKFLEALLAGTESIDGVKVDADFRWMLLIRLAAKGIIGEAEIAKEAAADETLAGKRNAATARAVIPTKENKKKVWDALLNDTEMSNEIIGATVAGFFDMDNRDLSVDYIKPYFEMLPKLWETRSNETAQTLTNGLFPAIHVSQSTVDAANAFIDKTSAPFGCKRLVAEGRDGIIRAMAAQAADK